VGYQQACIYPLRLLILLTETGCRNATLGLGDDDDRAFPEMVSICPKGASNQADNIGGIFPDVGVKSVVMSRYHTGTVHVERIK
jgi:hypothetical protein